MNDKEMTPKYDSDTILAYIDILGFKKLLNNEELPHIVEMVENILKADNSQSYNGMLEIKTNLISDTFVVYAQLTEPKHITAFLTYLGTIIGRIHRIGNIITRGYVSSGLHYSKNNLWISPVFVEAYEGEQKYSIHPRVIMSESAIELIRRIEASFIDSGWLVRDDDGFRFVNYMMCISDAYRPTGDHIVVSLGSPGLEEALIAHKRTVEYGLVNFKSYLSKYYWLANYHNSYITKNVKLAAKDELLIDLSQY